MTLDSEPRIPDPNGPPESSERTQTIIRRAASVSVKVFVGGTAALLVLACLPTRTMGALRSQRIKWQERQQEIAKVQASQAAESHSRTAASAKTDQPAEPVHD